MCEIPSIDLAWSMEVKKEMELSQRNKEQHSQHRRYESMHCNLHYTPICITN